MLNKTVKILVFCPLLLWFFGCSIVHSEKSNIKITNTSHPTPQPIKTLDTTFRDEDVESLCNRLSEIKKIPYRDPNDTDPIFEELIAKGKEAMPCLVEKITDETPMRDPGGSVIWQHYKVGDTAVFMLARIANEDEILQAELLQEMLPLEYRKEWKTNGVYAYYNYVSESKNREELQVWWRNWIKENLNSHVAQSRIRKTNLTETDRTRWFNILKWDREDNFLSKVNRFDNSGFTFYKLGKKRFLVEIITGAGAYQRSHVFAVLDERNWRKPTARLLYFTTYSEDETNGKVTKEITPFLSGSSSFDDNRKTLEMYYKAAGIGHCGSLETFKIVGNRVITIESKHRGCESATNGPPPEKWKKINFF